MPDLKRAEELLNPFPSSESHRPRFNEILTATEKCPPATCRGLVRYAVIISKKKKKKTLYASDYNSLKEGTKLEPGCFPWT